jgi:hypothetical protein
MQVAAVKPGVGSSSISSTSSSSKITSRAPGCAIEATSLCGEPAAGAAAGADDDDADAAACVERLIAGSPRKILGGMYDLPAQQHFYMETQVGR